MDLIELTRIIQAQKERDIETAGRNLRLLARDPSPQHQGWRQRWFGSSRTVQRPVSERDGVAAALDDPIRGRQHVVPDLGRVEDLQA